MKRPLPLMRRRFSIARWHTRLILWSAALCAGLVVVLFAKLAELALSLFFALNSAHPWLPLLWTPAIGMAVVWLTIRYFPGSQGSGIPQVIAATRLAARNESVRSLVSVKIAFGKVCLGSCALAGGYSAGREGPSVQVAASILHFCHRFLPHSRALRESDLILAGGAAGIAAAFNTPLAGIVFAVEELGRKLETRTSGILVSTVILAGLVAIALLGNYNYFGHLKIDSEGGGFAIAILGSGLACGLLGGLFSRLLLWPQKRGDFALWRWREAHSVLFAGACGAVIAIMGWASGGMSYGSGYAITSEVIAGGKEPFSRVDERSGWAPGHARG